MWGNVRCVSKMRLVRLFSMAYECCVVLGRESLMCNNGISILARSFFTSLFFCTKKNLFVCTTMVFLMLNALKRSQRYFQWCAYIVNISKNWSCLLRVYHSMELIWSNWCGCSNRYFFLSQSLLQKVKENGGFKLFNVSSLWCNFLHRTLLCRRHHALQGIQ